MSDSEGESDESLFIRCERAAGLLDRLEVGGVFAARRSYVWLAALTGHGHFAAPLPRSAAPQSILKLINPLTYLRLADITSTLVNFAATGDLWSPQPTTPAGNALHGWPPFVSTEGQLMIPGV